MSGSSATKSWSVAISAEMGSSGDNPVVDDRNPPTASSHILICDDDVHIRDVVSEMLMALGHTVTATDSGSAALSTFRAQPDAFDVCVIDQRLGDMTGSEVIAAIQTHTTSVATIWLSGLRNPDVEDGIAALNADFVVTKPITLKALKAVVDAAISARRHRTTESRGLRPT